MVTTLLITDTTSQQRSSPGGRILVVAVRILNQEMCAWAAGEEENTIEQMQSCVELKPSLF
jgi:hypothetical protein